jgi:hypothetical protein
VTAVEQGAATAPSPQDPRSWSRAVRLGALAFVVALLFGGLGYLVGHQRSPRSGPGAGDQQGQGTGTRAGCTDPDGVKQPLRGLVTVGDPPSGWADSLGGWSVNVNWADLQPEPGGPIVRPNAIDQAVQTLQSGGAGCAQGLKVRVLAGTGSPEWAKGLGGGALTLTLPQENRQGTVPRFWTDEFGRAYQDLQDKLAALYDGTSQVREVVIARCATFYAEPLIRQNGQSENTRVLQAAGWSMEKDQTCLEQQIDAHKVWRRTPSSLALNPYLVDFGEGVEADLGLPERVARRCREVLGSRCVLGNNSIRTPSPSPAYDELYAMLKQLGGPLEFQTAAPQRIGDPVQTVRRAQRIGAGSVELASGTLVNTPRLRQLARNWPG